ncbi:MAG: hypothetical protein PWP24_1575 [Clostridiales bacterium]|nr:hypothetical protein [Clostridiales bacterium]
MRIIRYMIGLFLLIAVCWEGEVIRLQESCVPDGYQKQEEKSEKIQEEEIQEEKFYMEKHIIRGEHISKESVRQEENGMFTSSEITDEIWNRIRGKSYKEDTTIPLSKLRYLKLAYYGFDEQVHMGEMIVNASIADDVLSIFEALYDIKYPIEKMELVDVYDADDNASMEANNTSAFNFRYIEGTKTYSRHAKGLAIDINPYYNPYVVPTKDGQAIYPKSAKVYADRSLDCPYYIKEGDACYHIFTEHGFTWGGDWNRKKDYQHFEKEMEN